MVSYLLNVVDKRVAVLLPVGFECVLTGEFVTAELQGDLKTVTAEVVEVLHPYDISWTQMEEMEVYIEIPPQRIPHYNTYSSSIQLLLHWVLWLTPWNAVPRSSISDALFEAWVVVVLAAGWSVGVGHDWVVHGVRPRQRLKHYVIWTGAILMSRAWPGEREEKNQHVHLVYTAMVIKY